MTKYFIQRTYSNRKKCKISYVIDNKTRKFEKVLEYSFVWSVIHDETGWNERIIVWSSAKSFEPFEYLHKVHLFDQKDMQLHLLLQLNEDFDDDLLHDALIQLDAIVE